MMHLRVRSMYFGAHSPFLIVNCPVSGSGLARRIAFHFIKLRVYIQSGTSLLISCYIFGFHVTQSIIVTVNEIRFS